jgi:hypothetical protein
MSRAFMFATFMLLASSGVASAEQIDLPDIPPSMIHWAITLLGLAMAAWLAINAFNRPCVTIAEETTLPRYMTGKLQYRIGAFVFILFACGFFLLLVKEHTDVIRLVSLTDGFGILPKNVLQAAEGQSTSYLVVICIIAAIYLFLLTQERPWNVVLMMRDVIQRWISIPHLVRAIMIQLQSSLHVSDKSITRVLGRAAGVAKEDFGKEPAATPDRLWAETCYMEWWLNERLVAGNDASFFAEESLKYSQLEREFQQASASMRQLDDVALARFKNAICPNIESLYKRFSRLVACYLVYRNRSRKELSVEARDFGIGFSYETGENPLKYWVVYVIALVVSVYVGVYISAFSFDLFHGKVDFAQDPDLALAWAMYTLSNFGLAILVILVIRFTLRILEMDGNLSHLVTYCWTFLVGVIVGPFGLTIAVQFSPYENLRQLPMSQLYFLLLKWGLGPGLVCVYISYYLDRQTYHDLPNIVHSRATLAWRLLNCVAFAAVTILLLMPPILTIKAQPPADIWPTDKLRFVSAGTTFCVVLGLALAAQFALRRSSPQLASPVPAPVTAA